MTTIYRTETIHRNELCPCGSEKKYKRCCLNRAPTSLADVYSPPTQKVAAQYIDTGEAAVRYVICDDVGTRFFVDKDGRILVFQSRADATAVATLEEFDGDGINVAGVGQTKWEHLQKNLPYVEPESVEVAATLVRERLAMQTAAYEAQSGAEEEVAG